MTKRSVSVSVAVALFLAPSCLVAQNRVPAGTILPVQLNSSVRSDKSRPGQQISARIMQDVPLPGKTTIRAGEKVIGRVLAVEAAREGGPAEVSLIFDTLLEGKQHIPLTTNLRALASMMDVSEAQVPETGPDRGTSEANWTTEQIGGDVVYRGGVVSNGSQIVGLSVLDSGVMARVSSRPGMKCRASVDDNDRPQAVWVFSSDACGVYGIDELVLVHAGRTDPVGQITVRSTKGNINIRAGSGMLLRVSG
ncbi:MAG TPA: hypothetical protein VMG31_07575 [Verrucomicrobiae bacterium]|nr:hypothetical protein [Verrucomicrobiae bacterium]